MKTGQVPLFLEVIRGLFILAEYAGIYTKEKSFKWIIKKFLYLKSSLLASMDPKLIFPKRKENIWSINYARDEYLKQK